MIDKSASIMIKITTIIFSRHRRVYTLIMTFFRQPTSAPVSKTKDAQRIALFYAGIVTIMVVAQLFTFEDFLVLMTSFNFPGGAIYAHLVAAVLVSIEVLALPFLLRMPLSPAFRWVSIVCGWLVALIWIKITVWLVMQGGVVMNVGFFGTAIEVMSGYGAVFMGIAFAIFAAWASWGMWPARQPYAAPHRQVK